MLDTLTMSFHPCKLYFNGGRNLHFPHEFYKSFIWAYIRACLGVSALMGYIPIRHLAMCLKKYVLNTSPSHSRKVTRYNPE